MRHLLSALLIGFLTATMAFPPQLLMAQDAAAPAAESKLPGLNYVPENAVGVGFVQADRFLTNPMVQAYPVEVAEAFGKKYLGLNPMKITSITFVITPPAPDYPSPDMFSIIKTSETLNEETFFAGIEELVDGMAAEEDIKEFFPGLKGKAFFTDAYPLDYVAAHLLDEHTFMLGSLGVMGEVVGNGPNAELTKPAQILAAANDGADGYLAFNVEPVRGQLNDMLAKQNIPPPFTMYKQVPNYTESITLSCHCTGKLAATMKINGIDEAATGRLDDMIGFGLELAKQTMLSEADKMVRSEDEVEAAMGRYQVRVSESMIDALRPKQEGNSLVLTFEQSEENIMGANVAVIGVLVALLLPALQAARGAARRVQSTNNLRQIGIAMHNFHDTFGAFPAQAKTDAEGKPLLSWRVMILPFIEQGPMFDQFHMDEPWDSEHNKQFIKHMPEIYRRPNSTAPEGYTTYLVPVGKNMVFEPTSKPTPEGQKITIGSRFRDITDGTSNTAMCVEVNDDAAVIWTKPSDLEVDLMNVWKGLGEAQPGGFNGLCCDASIRFISKNANADFLKNWFQRNDGKVLQLPRD
ncbi:hypothetical protein Pan97_13800 [Bremerella volcania]|uniref:DUF1559 domain-containing protein n=1 Tax=Bremerella volcania TaxID=2527984 RepID=A0A518C568_9BACT|nr:DUF1559 domain-containing protein [Bremerella volcania]QDU74373.1 hypothetical protein Pan97_13800 [Bremerella volcania]